MKKETYFVGGTALTMNEKNERIENVVIRITDGKIVSLHSDSRFQPPVGAKVISSEHCLLLPGLINCHTHISMGCLRGIAEDLPLDRWLEEVIFPVERKFADPKFFYMGSLLSLAELIRMGVTTINNMDYFSEEVASAVHEAGMRGLLGLSIAETSKVHDVMSKLEANYDSFLAKLESYPLVSPSMAPHAVYTVEPESFKRIKKYAAIHALPIHMHLAESVKEVKDCKKAHGKGPIPYCESLGLFDLKMIAAHVAVSDPEEQQLLARNKVGIAHNPDSNAKIGNPICEVVKLRQAGCRVGFGTDGVASNNHLDILNSANFGAKLQSFLHGPGALKTDAVVRMLTIEAAQVLGFEDRIGSLEVGKSADIIAIDTDVINAVPLYDPYSHLVYSSHGNDVKHSMVNGNLLMENRKLLTLDEGAIRNESRRWARKVAEVRTQLN